MRIVWQEHRFVARDGTDIYYRLAMPKRRRIAVLCDGIGCDGYMWRYMAQNLLANGYGIMHWNYPGHGLSGRAGDPEAIGIEHFSAHLLDLCDHLKLKSPLLMGHSMGNQVVLQAWKDGVEASGMVLAFGAAGRLLDQFGGNDRLGRYLPLIRTAIAHQKNIITAFWRTVVPTKLGLAVALLTELNAMHIRPADLMPYLERLSATDPEDFFGTLALAAEHDARPWLPDVDIPTLILAGDRDNFTPHRLSEAMHVAMPQAEYHLIPEASHAGMLEFPDEVADYFVPFIKRLAR